MSNPHPTSMAGAAGLASASIASLPLLMPSISLANDPVCRLSGDHSIETILQQFDRLGELLPLVPKEQNPAMDEQGKLGLTTALWVLRDNLRARRFYEHYGGKVITEREDNRDGTVLIELAYGWPDLEELNRRVAHD